MLYQMLVPAINLVLLWQYMCYTAYNKSNYVVVHQKAAILNDQLYNLIQFDVVLNVFNMCLIHINCRVYIQIQID